MSRVLDQSEHARRSRDRGRTARAWTWFSRRTIEAGSHYRDLSWRTVWVQALMASGLIVASRIDPGFALSPCRPVALGVAGGRDLGAAHRAHRHPEGGLTG
ncbi:hypothetical protein L2D00_12785 [Hyphomonadaceae bacterium BL14]|nr:hypothetical protein L2D00_12785 [Hyphomonadaceae bacterium BL14]